ncbi:MAG: peptide deformylase [Sulfuriflexus sp.]|nr:peptide deformylase [Sulfuriflexus sp.]
MTTLNILKYPDPRLRTVAKPVNEVTSATRQLIDQMFTIMYAAPGIGLAATQVDMHERIIVIDISVEKDQPLVLINPEITAKDGVEVHEEGCLSVPGIYEKVQRAETIKLQALDRNGKSFEIEADGLLAVCIQHEIDHLEGRMFVDYLSPLKQNRIIKKLEKDQKFADEHVVL